LFVSSCSRQLTKEFGFHVTEKFEKLYAGLVIKLHTTDCAQVLLMSDMRFDEYQKLQEN
jgi:hypothetical protein